MEQSEKLQKIIKYAGKNGYKNLDKFESYPINTIRFILETYSVSEIIFSHSFLKAFFKRDGVYYICPNHRNISSYKKTRCGFCGYQYVLIWKYYAQQLVITPEEDWVDYLYYFRRAE